jgi:uncharacterized protein with LGFP repeats
VLRSIGIPTPGAHVVSGAVRDNWQELGAEQSRLGYPVTDETPTGNGTERISTFVGAWIYWDKRRGAYEVYR